jgi:hypothetical protein
MNFGDNERVLSATDGSHVKIGIGEIVRADVHDIHAKMIKRGIADETLIICDMEFAQRANGKLGKVMTLMRDMSSEDYDGLLTRFNDVFGRDATDMRPTREEMRISLRDIARSEVQTMLQAQRVTIREQGDAVTRQDPPKPNSDKPEKGTGEPPKPKRHRERL